LLAAEKFYESSPAIGDKAKAVATPYRSLYEKAHAERAEQFRAAIEKIKGRTEWSAVPASMQQTTLQPLASRCCTELDVPGGSLVCKPCGTTLSQRWPGCRSTCSSWSMKRSRSSWSN